MSIGQQMFTVIATKGAERVQQEIMKLPEDSFMSSSPTLGWLPITTPAASWPSNSAFVAVRTGRASSSRSMAVPSALRAIFGNGSSPIGPRMARIPRPPALETPDPSFERAADRDSRRDALWRVAQQLHELTGDAARSASKTDELREGVADLRREVRQMRDTLTLAKGFGTLAKGFGTLAKGFGTLAKGFGTLAKGFGFAAIVLISACAALIWWLVGGKIDTLRAQMDLAPQLRSAPALPSR